MSTTVQEIDVNMKKLATILEDAGEDVEVSTHGFIMISTRVGYYVRIDILEQQKYITIKNFLPLNKENQEVYDFVNSLNRDWFMASYSIDSDFDLLTTFALSYENGLIIPQFMKVIKRFSSMIDCLVEKYKDDELFKFPAKAEQEESPASYTLN